MDNVGVGRISNPRTAPSHTFDLEISIQILLLHIADPVEEIPAEYLIVLHQERNTRNSKEFIAVLALHLPGVLLYASVTTLAIKRRK